MILSRTTHYALRAAVLLAERDPEDRPATVGDIAAELDIPRNYLSKILHTLVRRGLLSSERGPRGGFRLASPPAELKLSAIVHALEPGFGETACLLGRPICSDRTPCSAHHHWRKLTAAVEGFLKETTLEDLGRRQAAADRGAPRQPATRRPGRGSGRASLRNGHSRR